VIDQSFHMEFDDIVRLLDEFSRLPQLLPVEKTILEIAGYPHYENAASFFLEPKNGHGLERIVLESLLAAAGRTNKAGSDLGEISVEREARTGSGGSTSWWRPAI